MEIGLAIAILIVAFGLRLYVPTLLTRRALKTVINIFKAHGAVSEKTAQPLDQLGIVPMSGTIRFSRMGDYRRRALAALQEIKVIQSTDEGLLYLHVGNLLASGLLERYPSLAEGLAKDDP